MALSLPPTVYEKAVEVIDLESDESDSESSETMEKISDASKYLNFNSNLTETNSLNKNEALPPNKKVKTTPQLMPTSSDVNQQVKTAKLIRQLKYKEDKNFDKLLVLILKNSGSATILELWNFLSYLFPFYKKNFTIQQGLRKLRKVVSRELFLKTDLGKNKNLIMLNPVMKERHANIISDLARFRYIQPKDLCKLEFWEFLLEGSLNIRKQLNMDDLEELAMSNSEESSNIKLGGDQNKESLSLLNTEIAKPSEEILKLPTLNNTLQEAISLVSDDSNETVIFEPQITSCCTLTGSDSRIFFDDKNDSETEQSVLGQFVNVTFLPNSGSVSFANSVWSQDTDTRTGGGIAAKVSVPMVEDTSKANTKNFPGIDNCLPKWKRIFPWVEWNPNSKTLSCSICQSICSKINESEVMIVMSIVNADEIFKVSRSLREHADTRSHNLAFILDKKDIISILHFLLSFHFGEFNSVSDILLSFEGLMRSQKQISNEILRDTIKMLGLYLEQKTWCYLRSISKFSVITDPCCGLLIVKWLNKDNLPEEHIISSYMSINDKNPLQYLSSMGVDVNNIAAYISNARCCECSKCHLTPKVPLKSKTPLRLPQLDRYLTWLWRCKLLKPFYSLGYALGKLWFQYPHKFSDIQDRSMLNKLAKFSVHPEIFIKIFEQIDLFKRIAETIYQLSGNLEALGLLKLEVSELSKLISIFPFLSDINLLLVQFKFELPFSKNLEKLLLKRDFFSEHLDVIKDKIRAKEVTIVGLVLNDVDDVLNLVNLVIKEFQLPIYHKCRSVRVSFGRCISYDYLNKYSNEAGVQNDFNILYTALRPNFEHENTVLLKSLCDFLKQHRHLEKKDASTVLTFFQTNPSAKTEHDVAYDFYKHVALFGFEIPKFEFCLFEVKIYELLFYKSAWSNIGANIKEYLLTITSELSGQSKLSEKDMYLWWNEDRKAKFINLP